MPKLDPHRWIQIGLFVAALCTWKLSVQWQLFDKFDALARTHGVWDLDKVYLLVVNLTVAWLISLMVQARHLRRAIAQAKADRSRADRNARHDPLTGLPNRRAFLEHMAKAQPADAAPQTIAVLDLDRFKTVNDLHGLGTGDAMLCAVARRLEAAMGDKAFIARLGGDEFALLFRPAMAVDQVERSARAWMTRLQAPIAYGDLHLRLGCSMGLALLAESAAGGETLLQADKALYAAKRERPGQFAWYDAELDAAARDRALLEHDLRRAIEDGGITPYFQPVFVIDTGALRGFEVLARWHHPTRGAVPPSVFIQIAEECGLIADLGWRVIETACRAACDWGDDLKLSVNISPQQFQDPMLAPKLDSILAKVGFNPKQLEVEITESAVILDLETARQTFGKLRDQGIALALDDFGTGYSSLTSLRELDFDRLKIDRGFVTDIAKKPENQKIVAGIMSLANGLDLDVTAEGIETDADLTYMAHIRCSLGQGFWFDKAVPAEDVLWLMETSWKEAQNRLSRDTARTSGTPAPVYFPG
ncbi:MAG: EAL domain-containing protein [Pseudomonadota bacterium]